uniref:Uncharacterized protein n=1 Tax=Rhipicephalus microplus TaxID=6941 RepID=A0A6G5AG30_RHIMP
MLLCHCQTPALQSRAYIIYTCAVVVLYSCNAKLSVTDAFPLLRWPSVERDRHVVSTFFHAYPVYVPVAFVYHVSRILCLPCLCLHLLCIPCLCRRIFLSTIYASRPFMPTMATILYVYCHALASHKCFQHM